MNILDKRFKWTPAVKTDVQATWRKHGWVPPSEQKKQTEKKEPQK